MDGRDLIDAIGVRTAENEAVVDIALFRIHIHFFEGVSGVAFFGGDETGRHLCAGKTEGVVVLDVFLIIDTTA